MAKVTGFADFVAEFAAEARNHTPVVIVWFVLVSFNNRALLNTRLIIPMRSWPTSKTVILGPLTSLANWVTSYTLPVQRHLFICQGIAF